MNAKRKFILRNSAIRERCVAHIYELPLEHEWEVVIRPYKQDKTREQEEKYHAMIGDIKKSGKFVFAGRSDWSVEEIKRFLIDAFAAAKEEMGEPLEKQGRSYPSLDGKRTIYINPRSSEFSRKDGSDFIEWLYAYGSDLGVRWTERYMEQQ